jgi:hypothetical protein
MIYLTFIIIIAGFETFIYVVRHLDSTTPYLPTGLLLGSSVFPVLSFVLAYTSMLFWAILILPFFEHGRTM